MFLSLSNLWLLVNLITFWFDHDCKLIRPQPKVKSTTGLSGFDHQVWKLLLNVITHSTLAVCKQKIFFSVQINQVIYVSRLPLLWITDTVRNNIAHGYLHTLRKKKIHSLLSLIYAIADQLAWHSSSKENKSIKC